MGMAALAGCQGADEAPHDMPIDAAAISASGNETLSSSVDTNAMVAENDRIIAENGRMVSTLQDYDRRDPEQLDRLTAACRKKIGNPRSADGERDIFHCIRSAWQAPG